MDQVDPYAVQRIALYKSLFIATLMVYDYWLFLPTNLIAFFSPFLMIRFYESPALSSFKEKEGFLVFAAVGTILISVSFYLLYPFKVVLFFYSMAALATVYFYVLNNYYQLKNTTMLLLACGPAILNTEPQGNWLVVYDIVISVGIPMIPIIICLRLFPNQYLMVWKRALERFIQCLEQDIEASLSDHRDSMMQEEIAHLGMLRKYRRLVPKKYMLYTHKIANNVRNIQFSLDNLYYEEKNEAFWREIQKSLYFFRGAMKTNSHCHLPEMSVVPRTKLQHYVVNCLRQTCVYWNKLCSKLQH